MMETLIKFLEKELDMARGYNDWRVRKSFFDQAFGGLTLAIQLCGENWDEADKYVTLWNDEWKRRFEEVVYEM